MPLEAVQAHCMEVAGDTYVALCQRIGRRASSTSADGGGTKASRKQLPEVLLSGNSFMVDVPVGAVSRSNSNRSILNHLYNPDEPPRRMNDSLHSSDNLRSESNSASLSGDLPPRGRFPRPDASESASAHEAATSLFCDGASCPLEEGIGDLRVGGPTPIHPSPMGEAPSGPHSFVATGNLTNDECFIVAVLDTINQAASMKGISDAFVLAFSKLTAMREQCRRVSYLPTTRTTPSHTKKKNIICAAGPNIQHNPFPSELSKCQQRRFVIGVLQMYRGGRNVNKSYPSVIQPPLKIQSHNTIPLILRPSFNSRRPISHTGRNGPSS